MATKTFSIDNFPTGTFLLWSVTSQTANTVTVKLYDEKQTYFEKSQQGISITPPLAQGFANYIGSDLKLDITFPGNFEDGVSKGSVADPNGKTLAHTFNVVGEDADDKDFNDVCVFLTAVKIGV